MSESVHMARKLETFLNLVLKIYQAAIGALEAVDAPRFLCDAPLFVLKKSAVVEKVPLQIYCSALVVPDMVGASSKSISVSYTKCIIGSPKLKRLGQCATEA
jgi:hypothetical protein